MSANGVDGRNALAPLRVTRSPARKAVRRKSLGIFYSDTVERCGVSMFTHEGRYIYQDGVQIAATVAPDAVDKAGMIVAALNLFIHLKGGA